MKGAGQSESKALVGRTCMPEQTSWAFMAT